MKLFDFFAFSKKVLIEAKKYDWQHVPERDRMIDNEVEFAFVKMDGDKEIAVMEVRFDLTAHELGMDALINSGVATFENHCMVRLLKAADIPFGDLGKIFDPMCMLYYAHTANN